jgi:hypothetical protein
MRVFGRSGVGVAQQYQIIADWMKTNRKQWEQLPPIEIARLLRDQGFYSAKTSLCDIKVSRLKEMLG